MKKVLTLLFTFALAATLALPAFAAPQDAGSQEAPKTEKKAKKAKKSKKAKNATEAPANPQ